MNSPDPQPFDIKVIIETKTKDNVRYIYYLFYVSSSIYNSTYDI